MAFVGEPYDNGHGWWSFSSAGLVRPRLLERLGKVWEAGETASIGEGGGKLGLVVAPAGWGKTTVLSQFATWSRKSGCAVVWFSARPGDNDEKRLLLRLQTALRRAISPAAGVGFDAGFEPGSWRCLDDVIEALCELPRTSSAKRALIVFDNLYHLGPASSFVGHLVESVPSQVAVLVGTRVAPPFDLSRLRVSGRVIELQADELRFRSWEVEQLFRDRYETPLRPEELAELARRTEGWPACLQLFQLATSGKSPSACRQVLRTLSSRSRLVREYLTTNVLDELPDELREFLVRTCVLPMPSGDLCDALLDRTGSEQLLLELERRQIFTTRLDGEGTYTYHEILRSHLEVELIGLLGGDGAKEAFRRAGYLLEQAGKPAEALWAFCRAEDDSSALRMLKNEGAVLAAEGGTWIEAAQACLARPDPWLLMARARELVARGDLVGAVREYERAEEVFGHSAALDACRKERQAVRLWLAQLPPPGTDWPNLLRAAVVHDPLAAARRASRLCGPGARLAQGVGFLLAGQLDAARSALDDAASMPEANALLGACSRLLLLACSVWSGQRRPGLRGEIEELGERFARRGYEVPAMVARAVLGGAGWISASAVVDRAGDLAGAGESTRANRTGNWGNALCTLVLAFGSLQGNLELEAACLERAIVDFRQLGAPVLESWARSCAAVILARSEDPQARDEAEQAEAFARSAANPGASALAHLALGLTETTGRAWRVARAVETLREMGVDVDAWRRRPSSPPASQRKAFIDLGTRSPSGDPVRKQPDPVLRRGRSAVPVRLVCFGGFRLNIAGKDLPDHLVRPKARALLHLLCITPSRPVHREDLVESLWPESEPKSGLHSLQVAVSSVRSLVDHHAGKGAGKALLRRLGDAYVMSLPAGSTSDIEIFELEARAGHEAMRNNQPAQAIPSYERVTSIYDDLLPEDGPADWVVKAREAFRFEAATVAGALARAQLACADPGAAAAACEWGLGVDRYRDDLWRILVEALKADGKYIEARRAERRYEAMLDELGVGGSGL